MAMNPGMYASGSTEWETPQELFDKLDAKYRFDLDVCASKENAKCEKFYSRETGSLSFNWHGVCWMNPPYGRDIALWVRKASAEAEFNGATVVCLLPARTDTAWWHDYVIKRASKIEFIRGRLKFIGNKPDKITGTAPFPSAIVVFGDKYRELAEYAH